MQKTEFIRHLSDHLHQQGHPITNKEVSLVVNGALELLADALTRGEKVTLTGFGTFEVRDRSERNGVNPQTRERITIPATRSPAWTASAPLKQAVRQAQPVGNGSVATEAVSA